MPTYELRLANINTGEECFREYEAENRTEAQDKASRDGWVIVERRAKTPAQVAAKSTEQAVFWGILKAVGVLVVIGTLVSLVYAMIVVAG